MSSPTAPPSSPFAAPTEAQQLRLAVQNLACHPQAQRRYVQLGFMRRAVGNLDRIGGKLEELAADGTFTAEQATMIGELREQVADALARHDDFLEESAASPREFLFSTALENDAWEAIRQRARQIHGALAGEGSVFVAIMAK